MQETIEKGYYFNKNELLLLLGVSGQEEIYSFPLPTKEQFDEKLFLLTLHQLLKKGFLNLDGRLALSPETEQVLSKLRTAKLALTIVPAEEQMQKICYISKQGAVVLELLAQKALVRVAIVSKQDFLNNLFSGIGLSEPMLETEEEGLSMEKHQNCFSEERQRFMEQEESALQEDFLQWIQRDHILSGWEIFDLRQKKSLKRLLFLEGCLNVWILDKTEEDTRLCYDSLQLREEIRQFIAERVWSAERQGDIK